MAPHRTSAALAEAADLLGTQLQTELRRIAAHALPRCGALERRFADWMRRQGFDSLQRRALSAVTTGAALRVMARRRSLAPFLEQVEYNGRRLAKLDLPPPAVIASLAQYDALLAAEFGDSAAAEGADLRWVREQLNFGVVLTLNNGFYEVREAEAKAFYDLFEAELAARTPAEMLAGFAAALARFCRAEAGRVTLDGGLGKALAKPRYIEGGRASERLLVDQTWRGRFASCWSIPIVLRGRLAGAMQFGFSKPYRWLPRELRLLAAAGDRCAMALEKSQLAARLAQSEMRVRGLAERLQEVEEKERRRISRELHDETGQVLLCLRLQLERLEAAVPPPLKPLRDGLAEARQLAEHTITETRRLIADLSPAALEQLGLEAAVRQLAARLERVHGIEVRLRTSGLGDLPKRTQVVLYRLAQECSNNVARHSSARKVMIRLTAADLGVELEVTDDGVGFDPAKAQGKCGSMGLAGMRERVALLGGRFAVFSRPGGGTRIAISLPAPDGNSGGHEIRFKDLYGENKDSAGRRSYAVPTGN